MENIIKCQNPMQSYLDLTVSAKEYGGPQRFLNQIYLKGCKDTAQAAIDYYTPKIKTRDGIIVALVNAILLREAISIISKKRKYHKEKKKKMEIINI
ncbi:hypothetical protein EI71_00712 [Anaeroplasma bactoclasticum]|jgi:hypothetical protein|uniref:Uncharacterized protein n=1 Tax=Anaeroplasma bactoclasticum TaxID=2088 RepID=A0A397RZS4_9MOLU|nr:hypothetical protein [Anaeroplasma bactoclasticum]RIA77929.1 hypothetical protein EI71_00712 [Anaeroplasma bactoclasticum]